MVSMDHVSQLYYVHTKAELPQEGILFGTQFPTLGIFIKGRSISFNHFIDMKTTVNLSISCL